jgi:repressor LexA
MRPLTDRQREVLRAIHRLTVEHGYPPTLRDVCNVFGWSSTTAILDHAALLRKKGCLGRRDFGNSRSSLLLTSRGLEELGYVPPPSTPKTLGEGISAIRCSHCNVTRIGAGICPGCRGRIAA